MVSQFRAALIAEGQELTTVGTYLTHLRAALNWAAKVEMIPRAPAVSIPSVGKRSQMRGRPITEDEFQKLRTACDKFPFPAEWQRLLDLLWFSGLRLGEAMSLTWDGSPLR